MAMIPLSALHRHISVPLWYLGIFIFFMGSIFLIKTIIIDQQQNKVLSKTFYLLGILMSFRFLLSVVQRVQSDVLVLILLSLFIFTLYRKKDIAAGVFLAASVMVKLTPLIFIPYLILKKRFKVLFASLAAFVFYLFSPAVYLGWVRNLEYLKNWLTVHKTNPADYIIWYKNQSLLSCLLRFLTEGSGINILNLNQQTVYIIFAILALGLFSSIFIFCKKQTQNEPGILYLREISLILICMVIFSPLAWKHTFIHLLLPHMVLLYYVIYLNREDKLTRGLLISSFIINTMLNPELTRSFAQLVQLYSNVTLGTLILFVALIRVGYKLCKP